MKFLWLATDDVDWLILVISVDNKASARLSRCNLWATTEARNLLPYRSTKGTCKYDYLFFPVTTM